MTWTARLSTPGNDALTDGTIDHYSVYADSDNILIKEQARGQGTATTTTPGTVSHNLGYIPFYLAYAQVGASRYRLMTYYYTQGANWRVTSDTANFRAVNAFGTAVSTFRYYIFYDNAQETI